jgi:hypothetical protein
LNLNYAGLIVPENGVARETKPMAFRKVRLGFKAKIFG